MSLWWYEKNKQPLGPVDVGRLKLLLETGSIGSETRVWRTGMSEWVSVGSVPELHSALGVPPPLPGQAGVSDAVVRVPATPYERVVARLMDMLVHSVLAFIFLAFTFRDGTIRALERFQAHEFVIDGAVVWLASALLLEALLSAAFGNSIGKAIVGVRVHRLDSQRLTLWDRVLRGIGLFSHGFGIGIPPFNLACALWQVGRFQRGKSATYDDGTFFVRRERTAVWRTLLVFVAFVVLAGLASLAWDGWVAHPGTR